uniref:Uncharacterized protein n=1 Tax=viral metagenome TaxID=1070528 RepID=A0A6C0BZI5_9ZZZZ
MNAPLLTESGTRYYIGGSLKECRKFKDKYITLLFNLGMIALFIIFFGSILMYRYNGNISPAEIDLRNRKKKEYIISKLNQLGEIKQKKSMITDIPMWNNNPDLDVIRR